MQESVAYSLEPPKKERVEKSARESTNPIVGRDVRI
jgi:hypothetical protein